MRPRRLLFWLAAYYLAAALPNLAAAQSEADLELVLAVDVSGSVDESEYGLEMSGIAAAFRDPEVIEAAYRDGVRVFIEIGPGNSCSRMIGKILADRPHLARSTRPPRP